MKRNVFTGLAVAMLLTIGAAPATAADVSGHNLIVSEPPATTAMANDMTYTTLVSHQVCGTDDPDHPLHGASGDCAGACVGSAAGTTCMGSCTWMDSDGDIAFFNWTGESEGTWTLAGGSGKYEGASGSGTWQADAVYAGGMTGNAWQGTMQIE